MANFSNRSNADEHIDEMRINNFTGGEFMVNQVIETDRLENIPRNAPPAAPPSLPRRVVIDRVENAAMFVGQKIKLTGAGPYQSQQSQQQLGASRSQPPNYQTSSIQHHVATVAPVAYTQHSSALNVSGRPPTHPQQVEEIRVGVGHVQIRDARQGHGQNMNIRQHGGFAPGTQASDDVAEDD